ncbi:mannose-6-phosphate isomerase, type 1 [Pelagirhabdus alkalitolerans]|uniref:Mannose-6-phosphate isomerase n=1 Tax=Pelagirhabdus alkalitolerans TaxID=1612202 RepID=A0A1G6GLS5_9BACI|nr:mannose-6-phosphate isomerase, class I [Pelagirhabdus alkalitolerans]SDB82927.1 mannose-6-phosphate isomerase, type 1 [Pelagirhabdus alkalitolerans]
MSQPLFLKPAFQNRIWGGTKLKRLFHYTIPTDTTGEAWVISAHPNGPSYIQNGPLAGQSLKDAWETHPELFNQQSTENKAYPLLVKLLDANKDLSVQVHPDDKYAQQIEGEPYGKTECWYVVQAEEGAEIVFGHHAQSQEEFEQMAKSGQWNDLLRRIPVKAGDFVYVPSGTIHAIGEGIVILETQQSSDITYRVYDYDRTDEQGNTRELHLDSSIKVTTAPHKDPKLNQVENVIDGLTEKRLVQENYFTVYHWQLSGEATLKRDPDFVQISVIDGKGEVIVDNEKTVIQKGDHFIITADIDQYTLSGQLEMIASHS